MLSGSIVAIVTPMTADGAIDHKRLKGLVDWHVAEGTDGIVVANYLHRPLLPTLVESLVAGGLLVYETFARGNERFGKPSNPAFLLAPGELLEAVHGHLRVLAYEDLVVEEPRPAAVQRICARK